MTKSPNDDNFGYNKKNTYSEEGIINDLSVNDEDEYITENSVIKKNSSKQYSDYVFNKIKRKKHKKKPTRLKRVIIAIASVFLSLIIIFVATFAVMNFIGKNALLDNTGSTITVPDIDGVDVDDLTRTITYKGNKYAQNKNITTVLAVGVDKEVNDSDNIVYGTAGQADVIMIIAADVETGVTKTINIPRDTMTEIDIYDVAGNFVESKKSQVCLAYAYGDGKQLSSDNMIKAVSQLLYGIKINSYAAFDLAAIPVLNDSIGGVTLTSKETIAGFVKGQQVTLYGDDSTKYVRSRDINKLSSNLDRNARQIQYLQAFAQKAVTETKKDIGLPLSIYNELSPYMYTNIDAPRVTFFAMNAISKGFTDFEINQVPGEMKDAQPYPEFHKNDEKYFEIILNTFYNKVQ